MNHYFQFPLCLSSTVEHVRTGLDHIISFASVEIGKKRWEKFSPDERQARRSVLPESIRRWTRLGKLPNLEIDWRTLIPISAVEAIEADGRIISKNVGSV